MVILLAVMRMRNIERHGRKMICAELCTRANASPFWDTGCELSQHRLQDPGGPLGVLWESGAWAASAPLKPPPFNN